MSLSLRIYRATLLAYPVDLRREFADDMAAAFAADLASSNSIAASFRIWWCCLVELFRIALPAQRDNPVVMVPFIAFMSSVAWMAGPTLIGTWLFGHGDGPFAHKDFGHVVGTMLEGPCTVAFIGFLVARWNSRDVTYFSLR